MGFIFQLAALICTGQIEIWLAEEKARGRDLRWELLCCFAVCLSMNDMNGSTLGVVFEKKKKDSFGAGPARQAGRLWKSLSYIRYVGRYGR